MAVTADTIIADARAYADNMLSGANGAMNDLKNAIAGIPTVSLPVFPISIPTYTPIDMPIAVIPTPVSLILPSVPDSPTGITSIVSTIDVSGMPTFTATLGAMVTPNAPGEIGEFTYSAPSLDLATLFPSLPSALNATLVAPTFTDHAIPTAPSIQIPAFNAVAPSDITQGPGDYTAGLMDTFHNVSTELVNACNGQFDAFMTKVNPQFANQMSLLESKYSTMISGGSSINSSVENAIYERDKEKQNAEYKRNVAVARTQTAKWGFTLPNGYLSNAIQKARQSAADNNARASREVAINSWNKELEMVQFAMTQSKDVRLAISQQALGYFNSLISINNLALDAGKSVMQSMIEVYNALIKRYEISLEAYKTEASVYETRVRAATAVIEIYKAEIQAVQALTEVDRAKVEVYRGQIDAMQAWANIYKTQVDAVVSKAQLERLKIDVFGSQVEAYKAKISGKNVQWESYKAALQSNESTARIYGARVDAFGKQVEAYNTVIRARSTALDGQIKANEGIIQQYVAQVDAYKAMVSAKGEVARTEIQVNSQVLDNYRAELAAAEAKANSAAVYHKLLSDTKITEADQKMKTSFKQADLWMDKSKAVAQASEGVAKIYEGALQGATNGINALVVSNS